MINPLREKGYLRRQQEGNGVTRASILHFKGMFFVLEVGEALWSSKRKDLIQSDDDVSGEIPSLDDEANFRLGAVYRFGTTIRFNDRNLF